MQADWLVYAVAIVAIVIVVGVGALVIAYTLANNPDLDE